MKELSIEEKAKAYDEAIAHAKTLLKTIGNATLGNLVLKNEFEAMFPQLKESEGERIRKAIIEFFELQDDNITYSFVPKKDIIAWLEKQGEQNPAWSEEDDKIIKNIIYDLDYLKKECCSDHYEGSRDRNPYHYFELINWLKSLKDRYTWKPGEEQIIALRWVLQNVPYCKHKEEISGLLDQIKEL